METKIIKGKIAGISGCGVTNYLVITVETSDKIRLNEILGKDVSIVFRKHGRKRG